jgi:hypothetical protein
MENGRTDGTVEQIKVDDKMTVKELLELEISVFVTFENTKNNSKMAVLKMYDAIRLGEQYIKQIEECRRFAGKETDVIKNQYKKCKSKLPVWTSSCLCGNGSSDIVQTHNVLCIDIDCDDNVGLDVEKAKEDLIKLPSVFFTSLSVGGKGVFALMGLSGSDDFKQRFESVKDYILKTTGYVIDKSCCNPNRLRIISYDENCIFKDVNSELVLYPNKKSDKQEVYKPLINITLPKRKSQYDDVDLLEDDEFCICCADYCINRLGYQTTDYTNWLSNIGSLSSLGIQGEQLAIQLSSQSRGFKSGDDVIKTMKHLSGKMRNRQFLTRYFKMCKEHFGKHWIADIKQIYGINTNKYKKTDIDFSNHSFVNI